LGSKVTLRPWTNGREPFCQRLLALTFLRYCQPCLSKDITRSISHKPPIRKSSRKRTTRDFVDQHTESDSNKWLKMLEGKPILKDPFERMKGEDVCLAWLEQNPHAMEEPIIIESPEGLGMKMPLEDLTVANIAVILGEATPIEVIGLSPACCLSSSVSNCILPQMYLPNRTLQVGRLENGRITSPQSLPLVRRF
jgi:hypothetical protein